jgi:hypothetical protein
MRLLLFITCNTFRRADFWVRRATLHFVSYTATVINVMIASPGDVSTERLIARDVVHEWNTIHSEDKKIVLMPVGWDTHATPDMGDRPQGIINGQLVKKADLLVAVFSARLGSPTGKAESGTVEEIQEHLAAGKPAMIYFSEVPVALSSVDLDQYGKLKEFRQSLIDRGLYWTFENVGEFERKLSAHLARTVLEKFCEHENELASLSAEPTQPSTDIVDPILYIRPEQLNHPLAGRLQRLSKEARSLLAAASKDRQGAILNLRAMDGSSVQTNGTNFVERGNPRSEALWRSAVQELERGGYIEDRKGKGEVYFLTSPGYDIAELIATE